MEAETINKLSELVINSEKYQSDQITELHGIRESINLLNQETARLSDAYKHATEEFIELQSPHVDINTLITTLVGFAGVLAGSYIAYHFNKKLAESANKARVAVKRKNLIFEMLFDELFAINKSLSSLPENQFSFHSETTNSNGASFHLWNEMKNDTRKKYIPKNIRDDLQKVEDNFDSYFTSVKKFKSDVREIMGREHEKNYQQHRHSTNSEYSEIYGIYEEISVKMITYGKAFIRGVSADDIIANIVSNSREFYEILDNQKFINEVRKIITEILELPSLKDTEKNFIELKASVSTALKNIDDLIQRIIEEYEYGETL